MVARGDMGVEIPFIKLPEIQKTLIRKCVARGKLSLIHIQFYFPSWLKTGGKNFYVFGEVCTRVSEFWNHNIPAISAPFYTWAETDLSLIHIYPF